MSDMRQFTATPTVEELEAEIERLTIINKALMNALDAAIDYTIMRDRETYAALEDAITAATEAYDASNG